MNEFTDLLLCKSFYEADGKQLAKYSFEYV